MKTKGFTLVEVMVVISVIALLSSITMYSTAQARMKADDAKKKTEIKQVETAIAIKKSATGKVPRNYNCAGVYCAGGTGGVVAVEGTEAFNASMQELVSGGYISAIPDSKDDSYVYYATPLAEQAAFGASLQTGSVQPAHNKCSQVPIPAPYLDCRSSEPHYTGPNTVTMNYPNTSYFCSIYGGLPCIPQGNGLYASACTQPMWPGGPCLIDPSIISCLIDTTVISTCAGSGNDYCACVE